MPARHCVRLRLTLVYGGLFTVAGALLLVVTYLLVAHSPLAGELPEPTLPGVSGDLPRPAPPELDSWMEGQLDQQRDDDLRRLVTGSVLALMATSGVSLGLGWVMAGRVLRPVDAAFASQRQFVANASHELRTPVALQRTLVEVALADPQADADALRHACERVLAATGHQGELIDALLVLARSQGGLDRQEPVDLAAVAKRAVQDRAAAIADRHLRLDTTFAPAAVVGDPQLLERLVTNLVDNAIRHNLADGWIRVTTGSTAGRSILDVANSGPVVPTDEVDALLHPFRHLTPHRTTNDGHGLGLSIVAAVATAHAGSLAITPHPTGGLDVRITFP